MAIQRAKDSRKFYFPGFLLATVAVFWGPLKGLVLFSFQHEYCSHIVLIPFIAAYLLYLKREQIWASTAPSAMGLVLLVPGVLFYMWILQNRQRLDINDYFSGATLSIVLVWIAGFVFCYGTHALRKAIFPLVFLFLMIPLPTVILDKAIFELQRGSTAVSVWMFGAVGIPVLRQGFVLVLPNLSIEVARECSGIRSSMALFITCLLAGYVLLKSNATRAILVLLAVPFAVVKNGIRITTLCLLSMYVDKRFLTGSLHRDGGVVFFILILFLLLPILKLLQWAEYDRLVHRDVLPKPTPGTLS